MYFLNVTQLKQFYASDLGIKVGDLLRRHMRQIWPHHQNDVTLAIGFPNALWLDASLDKNLLIAMPAELGAMAYPEQINKVFVSYEQELPIADNTINRVILMHSLEHCANINELMQEIWRVLAPNGRVMCIVPNRLGLWARISNNPFGYGRPFSMAQIRSVIDDSQLTFLRMRTAIFMPPSQKRFNLKIADVLEYLGRLLLPMCGGLHFVEAEKQIYASISEPIKPYKRSTMKPAVALQRVEK